MDQEYLLKLANSLVNEKELSETVKKTTAIFLETAKVIEYKNGKYGDAALTPIGIFNKHIVKGEDGANSILVRLDDKLQRIKNSDELRFNDVCDIMGYLSLLMASKGWYEKEMFDKLKD